MTDSKITSQEAAVASLTTAASDPILTLIEATTSDPARDTVESLRARMEAMEAEHKAFKIRAAQIALRRADAHGQCGVVETTLREIGLPVPSTEATAEMTIRIKLTRTATAGRRAHKTVPAVLSNPDLFYTVSNAISGLRHNTVEGAARDYDLEFVELSGSWTVITDGGDGSELTREVTPIGFRHEGPETETDPEADCDCDNCADDGHDECGCCQGNGSATF